MNSSIPLPGPSTPRRTARTKNAFSPTKRSRPLSGPFECPVCCIDYPASAVGVETYALGCEHRFCKSCWKEYLAGKVTGEGESAKIQCMESGCNRIVREEVVDEFVDPPVSKKCVCIAGEAGKLLMIDITNCSMRPLLPSRQNCDGVLTQSARTSSSAAKHHQGC